MLFLLGDDRAELRAHEGLEEGDALQVRAVAEASRGGGNRGGLIAPSGAREIVSGVFQMAAQTNASFAAEQIPDRALDDGDDALLLLHPIEHNHAVAQTGGFVRVRLDDVWGDGPRGD